MEKRLNYFDLAENDYQYFRDDYLRGKFGNALCAGSQNICERYLKHLIDQYVRDIQTTSIMQTHNLRSLHKFLNDYLPQFTCDWKKVLLCNGYYFNARCPGDDAFITDKADADECWEAVEETRSAVIDYIYNHNANVSSDDCTDGLLDTLKSFDQE